MDILAILAVLLLSLAYASLSSARSYFTKGRLAGMEEAAREIIRGLRSHYEIAGQAPPEAVVNAIEGVASAAQHASPDKSIQRYHAKLWTFGDAVGNACWRKGFEACRQRMSPRPDRVRLDLPIDDLLDIVSLAHLGFRKMMPNDRGVETARFGGEDQAWAVARAVERLEWAIPEPHRPAGHATARQAMIRHWWRPQEKKRA
jgi:hypothetical protein